jgi:hypothetical protein
MDGSYTVDDKDLLSVCIDLVLLRMGLPEYERVISKLENDYNSTIADCYKRPEILKNVLREIFGEAHKAIINDIVKQLGEEGSRRYIVDFVSSLKSD